ncbi:hypothetical protein Zmor_007914 [Zophobas morio]|uniref:Uncharacterized protein n=1 Tax=Zophobas morio TaxID=2755281 RepID=A0AA38MQ61_9CUCU|nr:hypothetical protein Zmor_007914 [Zophobas morio]
MIQFYCPILKKPDHIIVLASYYHYQPCISTHSPITQLRRIRFQQKRSPFPAKVLPGHKIRPTLNLVQPSNNISPDIQISKSVLVSKSKVALEFP